MSMTAAISVARWRRLRTRTVSWFCQSRKMTGFQKIQGRMRSLFVLSPTCIRGGVCKNYQSKYVKVRKTRSRKSKSIPKIRIQRAMVYRKRTNHMTSNQLAPNTNQRTPWRTKPQGRQTQEDWSSVVSSPSIRIRTWTPGTANPSEQWKTSKPKK